MSCIKSCLTDEHELIEIGDLQWCILCGSILENGTFKYCELFGGLKSGEGYTRKYKKDC